ncbi:uncharacterized protein BT62DRAFT_926592 [Guyanagaster necrorhizus]|uniref:RRM domain-containing protein n=1 Tax=Guyanagaster necrorhizus TaxID=856835 RepID=A0A9P8AY17_9AGAR|nr:uncharacterized protein BT62DRAFT_926592 [Guyanagaster necrorhizus MCA 3950]KAG7452404.1 hypothetical protein BT62DRAFT_926592 [Guyanagaster necrorhizus MCA 3950]
MSSSQKLTKKQKKSIVFRERKSRKNVHGHAHRMDADNVPILEIQDDVDGEDDQVEDEGVGKGKNEKVSHRGQARAKDEDGEGEARERKKRKRGVDDDGEGTEEESVEVVQKKKQKKKAVTEDTKQRFLLFVGNLKYTTSLHTIRAHFAACDPPPSVRLLTPKATAGKLIAKSKGCAFLEFTHRNALQQALKLHQSQLDGRLINVELTAGGGGKGEARIQKVKERNRELHGQRKEKLEKQTKDGALVSTTARPQRYSATSGVDQVPSKKRTWTIDDAVENETHRGGVKHGKSRQPRGGKAWGTGVNAIPVG